MGVITTITLIIALLGGNALFVAAEFALISSRRDRIENLIANGNTRANRVLGAISHLSINLAACQLGITICSLIRQSRRTCHRPLPNNPLRTPRHSPPASASPFFRSRPRHHYLSPYPPWRNGAQKHFSHQPGNPRHLAHSPTTVLGTTLSSPHQHDERRRPPHPQTRWHRTAR